MSKRRKNPAAVTATPKKKRVVIARRGTAKKIQKAAQAIYAKNPGGIADFAMMVLPGFGAYAAARFAARVTYVQLSAKTKYAHHLSLAASAAVAVLGYYAGEYQSKNKKGSERGFLDVYQEQIVLGAVIATIQQAIQQYLPKFGWIVSDHLPPPGMVVVPNPRNRRRVRAAAPAALPAELEDEDEYEDEPVATGAAPQAAAPTEDGAEDFEDDGEEDLGIFGAGGDDDNLAGGSLGFN